MHHDNNSTRIRRELMVNLTRILTEGDLADLDRLPVTIRPRDFSGTRSRCCIHTERAILRYRIMALLGFPVEEEADELRPLSDFAGEALARQGRDARLLTVIEEACSACVRGTYFVSNACRGCMAQPCRINCPKEAISFERGRSVIDEHLCVDCGKCEDLCPFNAIVHVPVPCEESCPVKAIDRRESGKQVIHHDLCISCGRCMQACPFGAVVETSELVDVLRALKGPRPVVALVAPALGGQFEGGMPRIATALRRIGFAAVAEVAAGADRVAEEEAAEVQARLAEGEPFLTSSCCPAYTGLVSKHLPALQGRVSHTPTPMQVTSELVAERWPEACQVFLSPCLAKRREVLDGERVDHVLTFEELGAIFTALDVDVAACGEGEADLTGSPAGRGFAATGGVRAAVEAHLAGVDLAVDCISGLDRDGLKRLRPYTVGKGQARFLECMSCDGGCVTGPGVVTPGRTAARRMGLEPRPNAGSRGVAR